MNDIVHSFSTNLLRVLAQAAQLAAAQGKERIEPSHIFLGLTNQAETMLVQHLFSGEDSMVRTRKKKQDMHPLILSGTSKKLILDAAAIANYYNQTYIGTEHLFVSIIESKNPQIQRLMKDLRVDVSTIKQHLLTRLKSSSAIYSMLDSLFTEGGDTPHHHVLPEKNQTATKPKKISALEYFGVLLTQKDQAQQLDPVIGREKEIERLIRVLSRRTKNNPVLLGAPGVGKTAIVEGLAKKISMGDVPFLLRDKKIYSLNLTSLIAGSAFRGELELRFKQVLDEAKQDPRVILFIDEIHNIVGAGSSNGSLDVGNILKPSLARGEVRCIGATTFSEYKKYIEDDPALERRFQPIPVQPPSLEDAEKIITGLLPTYEEYHHVTITPSAVRAAVRLSDRYITEKCLPDKAIDCIDEAAALIKLEHAKSHEHIVLAKAKHRLENLMQDEHALERHNEGLKTDIKLNESEIRDLLSQINNQIGELPDRYGEVTDRHIAQVISAISHVPVETLLSSERERLLHLESTLSSHLVGQTGAKQTVAHFVRRAKSGLVQKGRPLASFAFLGPSGVGKTEFAKVLAQEIFGAEGLIKLDMSEFSESFTISRLIGAPSGYIGYKEGGRLTESVRQQPYSLVLFDEIEKAHPKILQLLLQILEDGCLTDAAGKKVDFSNTIIVLTSNVASHKLERGTPLGFSEDTITSTRSIKELVLSEMKELFSPELINRIDQLVIFEHLSEGDCEGIAHIALRNLEERLKEQNISFVYNDSVCSFLARQGYQKQLGARHVRHNIETLVENKIAEIILAQDSTHGEQTIHAEVKRETLSFLSSS